MVHHSKNGNCGNTDIEAMKGIVKSICDDNTHSEQGHQELVKSVITLCLMKMIELDCKELYFTPVPVNTIMENLYLGDVNSARLDEYDNENVLFFIDEEQIDLEGLETNDIYEVAKSINSTAENPKED